MIKRSLVIAAMIVGLTAFAAQAAPPKPGHSPGKLPDLVAKIEFTLKKTTSGGKPGVEIIPTLIVVNRGRATAKHFKVKYEWKIPNQTTWQFVWSRDVSTLGPDQSKKWVGNAADSLVWFAGDKGKAGFRFTVDYTAKVHEAGERPHVVQSNNVATKYYPTLIKR